MTPEDIEQWLIEAHYQFATPEMQEKLKDWAADVQGKDRSEFEEIDLMPEDLDMPLVSRIAQYLWAEEFREEDKSMVVPIGVHIYGFFKQLEHEEGPA